MTTGIPIEYSDSASLNAPSAAAFGDKAEAPARKGLTRALSGVAPSTTTTSFAGASLFPEFDEPPPSAAAACGDWAAACATSTSVRPSNDLSPADVATLSASIMETVGGAMERQWLAVRRELDAREKRQADALSTLSFLTTTLAADTKASLNELTAQVDTLTTSMREISQTAHPRRQPTTSNNLRPAPAGGLVAGGATPGLAGRAEDREQDGAREATKSGAGRASSRASPRASVL